MEKQTFFAGMHMYDDVPREYLDKEKGSTAKARNAYQFDLCKRSILYAKTRWNANRAKNIKAITKNFDRYNGRINDKEFAYLNNTYGKDNLARYQDYRLGKSKIDLLIGEYLSREKFKTVKAVNPEAQSELLDAYRLILGLKYAKPQVNKLRENGIEVLGGMEPMDMDDEKIFEMLSSKNRLVVIMQILFDANYDRQEVLTTTADAFKDLAIGAEEFYKVEVDDNGNTIFRGIDIRDALYEESDKDPFLLKSPYMGERRMMFPHEIYAHCQLAGNKQKKFEDMIQKATASGTDGNVAGFQRIDNQLMVVTNTIEFVVYKPMATKLVPTPFRKEALETLLSDDYYFNNKTTIDHDVKKGKYDVTIKYNKVVWEVTEIAEGLYHNCREKPNIIRVMSDPSETETSYSGIVFNSTDGYRVSVLRSIQELSDLFNVVMMIIGRETQKVKGKVLGIDEAFLKGTYEDTLSKMINDGIIKFDSSSDKAMNINPGATSHIAALLKEFDLGLTQTFPQLVALKNDLMMTVDQITGISRDRQGNTQASMTATNAVNSINISRTATEWLFFCHHRLERKVMFKFLQCLKITYGYYKHDEARRLLGDKMAAYLDQIKDIPLSDWDIDMSDGKKEADIRQVMRESFPQAIAAGEMRVIDSMEAQLSDSTTKALAVAKQGWKIVKDHELQLNQQKTEAKTQSVQMQTSAQMQMTNDARKHDAFMEILKYLLEQGKITQEAMNDFQIQNPQLFNPQGQQQALPQGQPAGVPA